MTLIIGMKCKEGVILVSDKKVSGSDSIREKWATKLHKPLQTVTLYYGASGFVHLFKQFNRKVPLMVEQKVREYELQNYGIMKRYGVDYYKTLSKIQEEEPKEIQQLDVTEKKETKKISKIRDKQLPNPPLIYGHEDFIQDCQKLVNDLCKDENEVTENKLEVLLILLDKNETRLHHISYAGEEEESEHVAIGSGSIFVNEFLEKFHSDSLNSNLDYCLKLATFCILYVQRFVKDGSVGVPEGDLPDYSVILNDGQFGTYKFTDEKVVLRELNEKVDEFIKIQDSLKF